MRGLEADPGSGELQDALEDVSRVLTLEQLSQARHSPVMHTSATRIRTATMLPSSRVPAPSSHERLSDWGMLAPA